MRERVESAGGEAGGIAADVAYRRAYMPTHRRAYTYTHRRTCIHLALSRHHTRLARRQIWLRSDSLGFEPEFTRL